MSPKLKIMRGLPSSGKSFRAREILAEHGEGTILSTDDYWYQVVKPELPEEYSFAPHLLSDAHKWNQSRAKQLIDSRHPLVIIDNTNTMKRETMTYVEYGIAADYEISFEEPIWERWTKIRQLFFDKEGNRLQLKQVAADLARESEKTHKVPPAVIESMIWRWEEFSVGDVINSVLGIT